MGQIIATTAQSLSQDALVTLYELDLTQWKQGIVRFCNDSDHSQPVKFNGYEYTPMPIKAEGFKVSGHGTLPTPTLTVAVNNGIMSLILSSNDLMGAPFKRIRTFAKHLDNGSDPQPTATLPIDYYVINRKAQQTSKQIQWELATSMDQQGLKLPARQMISSACTHTYRVWDETAQDFIYKNVTCPYAGTSYFDAAGNVVQDPAKDQCGKKLKDCQLRFGTNSELPTRAFPGIGKQR